MNYYELLEVSPNASPEVLKAAYKSLIQRYHPDRNPGDRQAAERSQSIVQAYQILSDSAKRATYDLSLKQQAEGANAIRLRTRDPSPRAGTDEAKASHRGLSWLVIALGALGLWAVWPAAEKSPPEAAQHPAAGSPQPAHAPGPLQDGAGERELTTAARTIPNYVEDLRVTLETPDKPADGTSASPRHVLSIKTIGVVAGPFDAESYLSLLEANKEYIGRRLAESLATADHAKLVQGKDRYLKRLILEAIGEITNTNRSEKYAFPGTVSDARYGAVEILLPDSFTVESQEPGKTTVEIWTPG